MGSVTMDNESESMNIEMQVLSPQKLHAVGKDVSMGLDCVLQCLTCVQTGMCMHFGTLFIQVREQTD